MSMGLILFGINLRSTYKKPLGEQSPEGFFYAQNTNKKHT